MAEQLARVDIGEMHLNRWHAGPRQRIPERDTGMGQPAGIDDDPLRRDRFRLKELDQCALMVRLVGMRLTAKFGCPLVHPRVDLVEGHRSIDLWLALSQRIEIRPVQHEYSSSLFGRLAVTHTRRSRLSAPHYASAPTASSAWRTASSGTSLTTAECPSAVGKTHRTAPLRTFLSQKIAPISAVA